MFVMRRYVLCGLLLWGSLVAAAQSETQADEPVQAVVEHISFGFLSHRDVLTGMDGYDAAQAELASMRETYEKELKRGEEQFSKQFAEYVEGQQRFPENILLKRQKELQQLMDENLRFREEARQLLAEAEEGVMAPLRQRLDDAIHRIGMERGYAFVLNTDAGAFPFVGGDWGTDITADVLKLLNSEF